MANLNSLWRLLLGAVGLVFMAGVLALGVVLGLAVYLWAKLRGRPLAPKGFRWMQAGRGMPGWAKPAGRSRASAGEVVDVEVREVSVPAAPLAHHNPARQD